jgi:hypothetical protein
MPISDSEMKTWTWVDKSSWARGPWDAEPDKCQWTDPATGLICIAVRSHLLGNWCGYVGLPDSHHFHGKGYDDLDVEVHGGLTFAGKCDGDPEHGICHVPEPGQQDHLYWFGFDCGHCFDVVPAMDARYRDLMENDLYGPRATYRDLAYVKAETESLARQLKEEKNA